MSDFRLKNRRVLNTYFSDMIKQVESALVFSLEVFVTELQNHAKNSAGYTDITANLRSSIGGVVLKDGKPITYRGFDGNSGEGNKTGLEFINSLISQFGRGYVLLLVAGMEYASYVENYHNLNVLKRSELKMNNELPIILNRLKQKINKL